MDTAESENLCMRGHSKRENREILLVSSSSGMLAAGGNGQGTSLTVILI